MSLNRRALLQRAALTALAPVASLPGLTLAQSRGLSPARLVVVLLRGGMDGLALVPAIGDPDHERARQGIATQEALRLDSMFGLHPLLPYTHELYQQGDLAVVHAVASAYRERSHFDGQNLVENGTARPYGLPTGWLNRALAEQAQDRDLGVAVTSTMPVIMRGKASVTSWSPSTLPAPNADTVERLARLYAQEQSFAEAFAKARSANSAMDMGGGGSGQFPVLMKAAGRFLSDEQGPRVAFVESGGWDTHAGQSGAHGALYRNIRTLDQGLKNLRTELGESWQHTALIAVTEFGRTVAMNGSNGTDHGTASCALLAGGAVKGGRVLGDWPGLKPAQQYEGRDLLPTTDMRALFKGLLVEHLGVREGLVEDFVFPDSRRIKPASGLTRVSSEAKA